MTTSPSDGAHQTILVVGGRGFVGSHITRALLDAGYHPHLLGPAMDCDLLADVAGAIGETTGSVEDPALVRDVLARAKPAAVISCAAFGAGRDGLMRSGERDADRAFAINVDGFRHLLEAAAAAGVRRVVWTSSTVVYGPATDYGASPVDEAAIKRPRTIYGLTKHLAEEVAAFAMRRHGIEVVGLRLPLVLGPGLWYEGAAAALMTLLRATRTAGNHHVSFHNDPIDLMHVRDVAAACLMALRHNAPLGGIYNINGFTASVSDMVKLLAVRQPSLHVTHTIAPSGDLFPLISDAHFRRDTGFAPAIDLAGLIDDIASAKE
ncbi:NAD(P)-dependent oxidoreductase [Reyranella sp. CPCC 100927]|uniref:NAD-dependent epimerase/dehydratase family protein n=1 Tax=Reyranella sp. CPCC 100927 TaxID=2599616 RepID=UPI0011B486E3|nr:NAD(P)-dependent oxidoreductase [Reyranella sp. CPCC 100927]TWT09612.1 NAD(P)-dependent oxidoreductase [Reyranella sp. CPCC 100927]